MAATPSQRNRIDLSGSPFAGSWCLPLTLASLLFTGAGCQNKTPAPSASDVPAIPVSKPVEREVTDYVEYTGRTDAVDSVDVRARVTGYLTKIAFKDGTDVKGPDAKTGAPGDLLFVVDPQPYQADLELAQARVKQDEAQLKYAEAEYRRYVVLFGKNSASQNDLEKAQATRDTAAATIEADKASLKQRELNLKFTQVTAPISGRISRYYLTLGNLVNQDQTLLTTIVSLDPMWVYFDMDERTLLTLRKAVNEGRIKKVANIGQIPVDMALADEDDYLHRGKLDFVNNTVNPSTGTILVRGVFANPQPPQGVRLLTPGMFVRIRLPIGPPHHAILVIDRALGSDQGLKYVFVVDKDNKIQQRRVKTGALQDDGLRVIQEGITPDDLVVVGALQQLRPRMPIEPELTPMPSLNQPAPDLQKAPDAKAAKGKA
jgi:multidrug efflux system membrane fusion protein